MCYFWILIPEIVKSSLGGYDVVGAITAKNFQIYRWVEIMHRISCKGSPCFYVYRGVANLVLVSKYSTGVSGLRRSEIVFVYGHGQIVDQLAS